MLIDDKNINQALVRIIDEGSDVWVYLKVERCAPFEYLIKENGKNDDIMEFDIDEKINIVSIVGRNKENIYMAIKSYAGLSFDDIVAFKTRIRNYTSIKK